MSEHSGVIRKQSLLPYILVLPVFAYYVVFWLRPVMSAVFGSFLDAADQFTLHSYLEIFRDPYFHKAAFNTFVIVAISVTLEFVAAYGLAILINTRFKGAGILLAIALVPMALPAVAVGAMWSSGFATYGWMNSFLCHLGILDEATRIHFYADSTLTRMTLIILIDAWQVIPFMMVILLAGMQNLDREMIEAGYVFGGTRWTVLRKITTPMMRTTIQTALVLRIISAIQIWLVIVMLFGFRRLPVLLEELVYYKEVLTGEQHFKTALAYSVLIAAIVSIAALLYLRLSGAFKKEPSE